MTLPSSVYKYLSFERARTVLTDLQIRFSQVSVLNDDLEFRPKYTEIGSSYVVKQAVEKRLIGKYQPLMAQLDAISMQQGSNLADEFINKVSETVSQQSHFQQSQQKLYQSLDTNFGILSLSETQTSALMWAFYADGGRGALIEFDPLHSWFWCKKAEDDSFRHLRRITYADPQPGSFLEATEQTVLYSKTKDWSFEEEWRIIRNFNDASMKAGIDVYGRDVLLFGIPQACVKNVIIGYKMTETHVNEIRKTLAASTNLNHVGIRHALRSLDGKVTVSD